MRETLGPGGQPISRSGSARSFNTTFGRAGQVAPTTPSPRPARANVGQGGNFSFHKNAHHIYNEFYNYSIFECYIE